MKHARLFTASLLALAGCAFATTVVAADGKIIAGAQCMATELWMDWGTVSGVFVADSSLDATCPLLRDNKDEPPTTVYVRVSNDDNDFGCSVYSLKTGSYDSGGGDSTDGEGFDSLQMDLSEVTHYASGSYQVLCSNMTAGDIIYNIRWVEPSE